MKTAIIYYSKHHGNTKKLLDAIKSSSSDEITLIDATKTPSADLNEYDMLGFASGIYYSKFDKRVLNFAKSCTPNGKKIFLVYTYGAEKQGYTKAIREALAGKSVIFSANTAVSASTPSVRSSSLAESQKITRMTMKSKMPSIFTTA